MNISNEKADKLLTIAKMYYEESKTQNEIAKCFGISRPLVSRYLNEARTFGIVHIEIRSLLEGNSLILNQVRNRFNIKGGVAIPNGADNNITDAATARATVDFIRQKKDLSYGLGWGSIIGTVISILEKENFTEKAAASVCPLLGNSGVSNRNYHSNELTRAFAQKTGAQPVFLYAPAIVESEQELQQIKELENYKSICRFWENMDVAIVNIGNYPSVPDFATAARYGSRLVDKKAVGRFLGHYVDINGAIIRPENDFALQIPVEMLARTHTIIGVCASNVKPKALIGALSTGLFTILISPEELIRDALEYN